MPGGYRMVFAKTANGIFNGFANEFNMMTLPSSVFNGGSWHVSNRNRSDFAWIYDQGFNFLGLYDTSDGDRNIVVVDLRENPVEWKGFFYTTSERKWKGLNNDWIDRNMFDW